MATSDGRCSTEMIIRIGPPMAPSHANRLTVSPRGIGGGSGGSKPSSSSVIVRIVLEVTTEPDLHRTRAPVAQRRRLRLRGPPVAARWSSRSPDSGSDPRLPSSGGRSSPGLLRQQTRQDQVERGAWARCSSFAGTITGVNAPWSTGHARMSAASSRSITCVARSGSTATRRTAPGAADRSVTAPQRARR